LTAVVPAVESPAGRQIIDWRENTAPPSPLTRYFVVSFSEIRLWFFRLVNKRVGGM